MDRSPSKARRGWHWTDYWRAGREAAVTFGTPAGAEGLDSGALWRGWFAAFPAGARLLDLATGGGRIAGYALEAAATAGKSFEIVGVDYAEAPPLAGCTLLSGVALERMPLPPEHFDGASSQFGIEYADPRPALAELFRVLKPGGRALMLMHHADSVISRQTADQVAAHDRVLGGGAAFRQARRAFAARAGGASAAARAAADAGFRHAVERAAARLKPDPAYGPARYLVDYLTDLAARADAYEPASALARLDEVETGSAAWRRRQTCQIRAALDAAGLEAFVARAVAAGLEPVERGPEHDARGALVGWRLALAKP
ncbi:MAG: methyltransferase domain-containing protein [Brevundimonas sp.]|uniref:methyltransferase domain-containing protein n=1 Tax=Brevundimonas sp. TaxID=1871086 RepID=UPI0017D98FE7|nr:methyltransferase domain-containing protein [Brevundimonas sp.]MBA4805591.1 methyltransferase domain-containing protein [Brevundimonas sp.]